MFFWHGCVHVSGMGVCHVYVMGFHLGTLYLGVLLHRSFLFYFIIIDCT